MQRILIALEPGMRSKIHQLKPKMDRVIFVNELISGQLTLLSGWKPQAICQRWGYTPPSVGKKPKAAGTIKGGASAPTPGTMPGSGLDDIVKGLRRHRGNINAPLTGVAAIDTDIRRDANEVVKVLLPAARQRRDEIIEALAATAGTPVASFRAAYNSAIEFHYSVEGGVYSTAKLHFRGAVAYLRNIGLLVDGTVVPGQVQWTPPSKDSEPITIYVPFDQAEHKQLDRIKADTGLGKEQLCRELIVSALAGLPPRQHIERQFESMIMLDRLVQLLRLIGTITDYESRLKANPAPPEKDPTLGPFLDDLKHDFEMLKPASQRALRMLVGAILARSDDEAYAQLIWRANEARRLARLGEFKTVDDEICRQMNALLAILAF